MKVYFLWGNPIALILVSIIMSAISFVFLMFSFINENVLPFGSYLAFAFTILYSTCVGVAFYVAYRRSDYAFMSPKKYRKAMLVLKKNEELKAVLEKLDSNNAGLSPEKAIDKAIEVINSLKA